MALQLCFDVDVNPVTNQIWVVGCYWDTEDILHSYVVIFDEDLNTVKKIDFPAIHAYCAYELRDVCFDDEVLKFNRFGNVLRVNKGVRDGYKILCTRDHIYVY